MTVERTDWRRHAQDVIRSGHYTWLSEGLAGEPLDEAMTILLTDIRHVCQLADLSFDELLERSALKFEKETAEETIAAGSMNGDE